MDEEEAVVEMEQKKKKKKGCTENGIRAGITVFSDRLAF